MIERSRILPLMLVISLMIALLSLARPVYGQDTDNGPIHMAALLANMQKTIDAKKAKPGETFTVKTVTPATLNDGTVIPVGSILEGHVDSATPSEHHSDSTLVVTIDKLHLKGGKEIAVKAVIVGVTSLLPSCAGCGFTQDSDLKSQRIQGGPANVPDDEESEVKPKSKRSGIKGLSVISAVTASTSASFTQKRKDVRLTNEDQFEVGLAVIPAGVILEK